MRKFLEASILQNRTVLNSIDKPTSLMAIVNILIKSLVLKALSSMHKSKINTSFSLRAGEVLINFQIFTLLHNSKSFCAQWCLSRNQFNRNSTINSLVSP